MKKQYDKVISGEATEKIEAYTRRTLYIMALSCGAKCMKWFLFIFNAIFLLIGLGLIALGVYMILEKSQFTTIVGEELLPICSYVLIGVGAVVLIISFAGCCGAIRESKCLLMTYFVCLLLVFFVEAAAAVLAYMYYDEEKLTPLLEEYVLNGIRLKYGYSDYELLTTTIDWMQEKFKCCGYLSADAWKTSVYYTSNLTKIARNNTVLPLSCCKVKEAGCNNEFNSTVVYTKGCLPELKSFVQDNLLYIGGGGIGIAVIQLFGLLFSLCLFNIIRTADNVFSF